MKHSEETKKKISEGNKGKEYSIETRLKISKVRKGRGNGSWRGGITPLVNEIRNCFEYRQWRLNIFRQDNFICQICGEKRKIEADHYPKMFSTIFHENKIKSLEEALACEEFWNINNGRTLCESCHPKPGKQKLLCLV